MSLASSAIRHGVLYGTGAAVNVSLGFIPRRVDVFNVTDGTVCAIGFLDKMIAFTTGAAQPAPGCKVKDLTSGATGQVKDFILVSGTFAAGNAAGFLILDADTIVGAFGANNLNFSSDVAGATSIVATAAPTEHSVYQSAALGFVAGGANTSITSYVGSATAAKGFTIGSTIAANTKLLRWTAYRNN